MDLDLLRAIDALARHGTMTAAARAIGLSQPALHGQLARLGEAVGAPLYRRSGRGLVLTEAGVRVVAFARETEERVGALREELAGGATRQPIILAAGQGAFRWLLGP